MFISFELAIIIMLVGIVLCVVGIFSYKNSHKTLAVLEPCQGESAEETEELESDKTYYRDKKLLSVAFILFGAILLLASLIGMFSYETDKYTVLLEGNEVQIPCSYYDIEDYGFVMETEERMNTLEPGETDWVVARNLSGEEIELILENRTGNDKSIRGCTVVGISVDEENGPDFWLTNGVEIGKSYDEVTDILGVGSPQYWSDVYTEQIGAAQYKISIGYDNSVISVNSGVTNNSYVDIDSLMYMSTVNFFDRPVTSISVRLDD